MPRAIANGVSPDRFAWRRLASKRFGRTKIRVLYPLSAKRIQGHELPSAQKDRPLPQTAVPDDPVANRRWIGGDHLASRFGSEIFSTVVVDQPRRMKTQDRPSSDADPIMRDRAQDKRASRITGTVDDDAFSGMPQHPSEQGRRFKSGTAAINCLLPCRPTLNQRHLCSVAAARCASVRVRGSSTSTVRCSVGFGVAVTNVTPSGA